MSDRARRARGLFVILCGAMGAAAFWSTALAEIGGVLLLLVAVLHFVISGKDEGILPERRDFPVSPLILWVVYVAGVLGSVLSSPAPFFPRAGLLWHPLLFPAALLVPLERRPLGRAGTLFVVSGAAAAAVTVLLNYIRRAGGSPYTFTGLTTFADLLVLAGIVGVSLLFHAGWLKSPAWEFALPTLLVIIVLVWSAERAPVLILAAVGSARAAAAGPRPFALWVLLAGTCLLLAPPSLSEKIEWLIHGNPLDRYVVWEEGFKQAPHAPLFGYGPGSYPRVVSPGAWNRFINRAPSSWHNDVLETWLDSGPMAAGALGGLLMIGVFRGLRNALRRPNGRTGPTGGETGVLFLCCALFGLVGSVVTTSVLGLVFWLLLGLTLNSRGDPPSLR